MEALAAEIGTARVSHIFVTHTHNDHSPLAAPLKQRFGAATYGFGRHGSGRAIADMPALEEGGDKNFIPDHHVKDGDIISCDGFAIECVFTPGHTSNHMCFALVEEKKLFTGDHIMSWSTSVVVPPDGHMGAYMDSLARLLARDDAALLPGAWRCHCQAQAFCARLYHPSPPARGKRIKICLEAGIVDIGEMVAEIYRDIDQRLHPAAAMTTLAHLQHMAESGHISYEGDGGLSSVWRLAS